MSIPGEKPQRDLRNFSEVTQLGMLSIFCYVPEFWSSVPLYFTKAWQSGEFFSISGQIVCQNITLDQNTISDFKQRYSINISALNSPEVELSQRKS